jgi:hypothetical protein
MISFNDIFQCRILLEKVLIFSDGCNEIYLGESVALRARLALHKSHIANPHLRVQHVSSHLQTCGGQNSNFSLFIEGKLWNRISLNYIRLN